MAAGGSVVVAASPASSSSSASSSLKVASTMRRERRSRRAAAATSRMAHRPLSLQLPLLLLLPLLLALAFTSFFQGAAAEMIRLDAGNFELAVQTYPSLAILFYGKEAEDAAALRTWEAAARLAEPEIAAAGLEMGFAAIDATSPDVDDLVSSYGFTPPAVQVFRRKVMYHMETDVTQRSASELAAALLEEARPAAKVARSAEELEKLQASADIVVVGLFPPGAGESEEEEEEELDGPYAAFQAAADQLRGYAAFVHAQAPAKGGDWRASYPLLLASEEERDWVLRRARPLLVYLDRREEEAEGAPLRLTYFHEDDDDGGDEQWTELSIVDWVMSHDVPPFGLLAARIDDHNDDTEASDEDDDDADAAAAVAAVARELGIGPSASGEGYASKFFTSALVKFVAFLRPGQVTAKQLKGLAAAAERYRGQALFAFVPEGSFPQAWEYFQIHPEKDCPALVFYDPQNEQRLRSPSLEPLHEGEVQRFVSALLHGTYLAPPKSEKPDPEPSERERQQQQQLQMQQSQAAGTGGVKKPAPVRKLVGSNFRQAVAEEGVDVLVLVTRPLCPLCLDLSISFELLGKALQAEPRVRLAKVDAQLNDLPPSILSAAAASAATTGGGGGESLLPLVLLFPARSKPYTDEFRFATYPRPSSPALQDLADFLTREGSFAAAPAGSAAAGAQAAAAERAAAEEEGEGEEEEEGGRIPRERGGGPIKIATIEQMGALAIDEDVIRSRLEAQERALLRNHLRRRYALPWLDKLAGEVIFDGHLWHLILGALSLLANLVLFLLMTLAREREAKARRQLEQLQGEEGSSKKKN